MTKPEKYLFDKNFDTTPDVEETSNEESSVEENTTILSDEELEELERRSYEQGYDAGYLAAADGFEATISESMEKILVQFDQADQNFEKKIEKYRQEAVQVATKIAVKICGNIGEREPLHDLIPFLQKAIGDIKAAPNLVIHVAKKVVPDVEARLKFVTSEANFSGALTVKGRENMPPQDAAIEWQDGRMDFTPSALGETLDALVGTYFASNTDAQSSDSTDMPMSTNSTTEHQALEINSSGEQNER